MANGWCKAIRRQGSELDQGLRCAVLVSAHQQWDGAPSYMTEKRVKTIRAEDAKKSRPQERALRAANAYDTLLARA